MFKKFKDAQNELEDDVKNELQKIINSFTLPVKFVASMGIYALILTPGEDEVILFNKEDVEVFIEENDAKVKSEKKNLLKFFEILNEADELVPYTFAFELQKEKKCQ